MGETDQAEAKHCDPHRSVQAIKPYFGRNGSAQTLLQLPFTSNHESQNLGFRGATEAPPRPKFGCYPLNGREAGDTRVQVSVNLPTKMSTTPSNPNLVNDAPRLRGAAPGG
ncbi:hypothetical protein H9L39_10182 [Fusarium oxysporum f. sp. albedinis]|nr:hypothetical protein H9L39_10182 [Fusarium oxysporum f. sp. albedinis]